MDELTKEKDIYNALSTIIAAQKTLSSYGWSINNRNYTIQLRASQKKIAFLQYTFTSHYESECLRYIKMVEDCNSDLPKRGKEVRSIKEKIADINMKTTRNTKAMSTWRKQHHQTEDMLHKVQHELEDIIKFTQEVGGMGKSARQHDVEAKIAVLTNELHEISIQIEGCKAFEVDLKRQLSTAEEELLAQTKNCPCNMFSEIKNLATSLMPPGLDMQEHNNFERALFKKFNRDHQCISERMLGVYSCRYARPDYCACHYNVIKCPCCDKVWVDDGDYRTCGSCGQYDSNCM